MCRRPSNDRVIKNPYPLQHLTDVSPNNRRIQAQPVESGQHTSDARLSLRRDVHELSWIQEEEMAQEVYLRLTAQRENPTSKDDDYGTRILSFATFLSLIEQRNLTSKTTTTGTHQRRLILFMMMTTTAAVLRMR